MDYRTHTYSCVYTYVHAYACIPVLRMYAYADTLELSVYHMCNFLESTINARYPV